MCLIVQRKPNFEIPFDKFKAAIENNGDGYGLAFPDNGRLKVLRSPEEPDPDQLYRLINEELIDKDLLIHLRYTTVGETTLRNAHPFPILEKNKDGIDLRMAHNGTLGKYRPASNSSESDTRRFVVEYVRPLFKRLVRGCEPEELLSDSFVKQLLEDQLTTASVLTFIDSEGNSLICNETGNGGKLDGDWYYSNTYSFQSNYRKPAAANTTSNIIGYPNTTGVNNDKFKDCNVKRFSKKYDLDNPRDLLLLDDDTITEVSKTPEDAELLIKELLNELYYAKGTK